MAQILTGGKSKEHICRAFHLRFVAEENMATASLPRYRLTNSPPREEILKQLLELQIQSLQFSNANQLLSKFDQGLDSETGDVFAILVRNGAFEMAATQLRTKWKKILADLPSRYRFDPEMGKSLTAFLEWAKNEQPWVANVGELVIGFHA